MKQQSIELHASAQLFWAKSKSNATGRDHLGIQNASIITYSTLLPGLTNLTQRIRYYGFYSWILNQYQLGKNRTDNRHEQHLFIRKSELLLSFLMSKHFADVKAVGGSNFTSKILSKKKETDTITLAEYAVKSTANNTVYWKYDLGVFGQYYYGSMFNLKLVGDEKKLFFVLDNGEKLANAFDENVAHEKALFLEIVEKGAFKIADLENLKSFSLNEDFSLSTEGVFYKNMLAANDNNYNEVGEQTSFRRKSLITLLANLDKGILYTDLPQLYYDEKGFYEQSNYSNATLGWYYFQANELVHYALETIFWGILSELDEIRPKPILSFLDDLLTTINNEVDFTQTLRDYLSKMESESTTIRTTIASEIGDRNIAKAMKSAFDLLCTCYIENESMLNVFQTFALKNKLKRSGNVEDLLRLLLERNLDENIETIFRKILLWLINHHTSVAYRKMGNGVKNVFKFRLDNGLITLRQMIQPGFTSPRLRSLYYFLCDLKLYNDATQRLSGLGQDYLHELQNH